MGRWGGVAIRLDKQYELSLWSGKRLRGKGIWMYLKPFPFNRTVLAGVEGSRRGRSIYSLSPKLPTLPPSPYFPISSSPHLPQRSILKIEV
jgi:hypothetical protein